MYSLRRVLQGRLDIDSHVMRYYHTLELSSRHSTVKGSERCRILWDLRRSQRRGQHATCSVTKVGNSD
jgi:hypothetical protein